MAVHARVADLDKDSCGQREQNGLHAIGIAQSAGDALSQAGGKHTVHHAVKLIDQQA